MMRKMADVAVLSLFSIIYNLAVVMLRFRKRAVVRSSC
jgi:hypothetical protein